MRNIKGMNRNAKDRRYATSHFDITGNVTRLVTAMYFEGEALNDQDRILKTSFNPKSQMTQAHSEENALRANWDIVLITG